MAREARSFDAFMSHNSADKPLVKEIGHWLEDEAGLRVWLDEWNLLGGYRFLAVIGPSGCGKSFAEQVPGTPRGWAPREVARTPRGCPEKLEISNCDLKISNSGRGAGHRHELR